MPRRLREKLSEKATRYGNLLDPFIIAVWSPNAHIDNSGMEFSLFGVPGLKHGYDLPAEPYRAPNGLFTEKKDGRYRFDHVSGIVFFESWPFVSDQPNLSVYHNPYAQKSLPEIWFAKYPQLVPDSLEASPFEMLWKTPELKSLL